MLIKIGTKKETAKLRHTDLGCYTLYLDNEGDIVVRDIDGEFIWLTKEGFLMYVPNEAALEGYIFKKFKGKVTLSND